LQKNAKTADGSSTNKFAGMSIWLILLLIVVGGIALNLTPCVLPMMPITIAVLGAGTQAESKEGFFDRGFVRNRYDACLWRTWVDCGAYWFPVR